jgi:beta-aspartyl-peptidase (threonine type)
VAAAKNVLHPVTVARKVMENSEHCLIVGEGVQIFMKNQGIPFVSTEDLMSQRELGMEFHK